MVTNKTSTYAIVYGTKDNRKRWVSPFRGIAHDWVDCGEALEDWLKLWTWRWNVPLDGEGQIRRKTFFNPLGQPLYDADDYETLPEWDKALHLRVAA